nr:MAG TPA: hypothetical protein [Caudoviricetes sp.]
MLLIIFLYYSRFKPPKIRTSLVLFLFGTNINVYRNKNN